MRALKLSILGLVLGAISLAAQPAFLSGGLSTEAPKASPLDGSRYLFYRLPADSLKAARKSFVLRVSLNGRPFADETFRLGGGEAAPTVELFALAPDLLDHAYERARRPTDVMTVTVLLDGKAVHELTWGEFLRYNQEIRKADFHPVAVPSEVKSYVSPRPKPGPQVSRPPATKGVYTDPYCADECASEEDVCLNQRCDPRGDDCQYCYVYYNDCMLSCPTVCEDPRSVNDTTTQSVVSTQSTGAFGCYNSLFGGSFYYGQIQATIKNTTVRHTTNCDYTTSDQVLSVWYTYSSCFQKYQSCYPPVGGTMYQSCST
jgi:hypothetical protein